MPKSVGPVFVVAVVWSAGSLTNVVTHAGRVARPAVTRTGETQRFAAIRRPRTPGRNAGPRGIPAGKKGVKAATYPRPEPEQPPSFPVFLWTGQSDGLRSFISVIL